MALFDPSEGANRRWGAQRERERRLTEALLASARHRGDTRTVEDLEQRIEDERLEIVAKHTRS